MTIADINTLARFLCDADTTSLTAANLLIFVNRAYEQVVGWLINADGVWEFDDSNFTTTPIATYTLVNGQRSYTFASDFLDILEVSVMNTGGTYIKIPQFDPYLSDASVEELYGTQSGFPEYYDLVTDDTIKFYPNISSSSVTLSSGLQVKFKRTADVFTSDQVTTGTKTPGFASPWHSILSYMSAIPYCSLYKKDRVPMLMAEVERMKKELIAHYARRNKDERKIMTMKQPNFI